jgi:hypothetical protein
VFELGGLSTVSGVGSGEPVRSVTEVEVLLFESGCGGAVEAADGPLPFGLPALSPATLVVTSPPAAT